MYFDLSRDEGRVADSRTLCHNSLLRKQGNLESYRELQLIENERANFRNLFKQTPEMVCILKGPDHVFEFVNEAHVRALGFDATGRSVREAQPESVEVHGILDEVYRTGVTAKLFEIPVTVTDRLRYFNLTYAARRDQDGEISGVMILGTEVTEQVLARRELRESQELLSFALSSAQMGPWSVDLKTGKVSLSDEASQIFGSLNQYENVHFGVDEFIHPDDRENVRRVLTAAIASASQYEDEYRIIRKDGVVRWLSARGRVRLDQSGYPTSLTGVVIDITQRKMAEESLRLSESKFRTITDAMPQMVWSTPPNGEPDFYNQRWYEFTGVREGSTDGPEWVNVIHPDDQQRASETWMKAVATGQPYEIEYRLRHNSGGYRWVLGRALPVTDDKGNVIRWMGTCTDVHEQKLSAEQLSKSKLETERILRELERKSAFLETIIEQMPMAVVFAEAPSGKLIFANSQLNQVWRHGFIPADNVEEYREYIGFHPDGRRFEGKDWPLARAMTEKRVVAEDCDVLLGDGTRGVLRIIGAPVKNEKGEVIAGIVLSEDITEQKRNEAELNRAKVEAESANQMKTAFLANMSHEIRTPLGAILGFTDLLKDPSIKESDRLSYLEIISRNGEQLTAIINDILDLSKIEAGYIAVETLKVSPRAIVEDAASLLKIRAFDKDIQLNLIFEETLPSTIGTDPTRLRQIVFNILGNAIKFTHQGGVTIRTGYRRQTDKRGALFVEVSDTGIGISEDQQSRLFKVFSQADETMTRKFGGTGLGLVLSKRLAEALGGSLRLLRSAPSQGSVFSIEIEDRLAKAFGSAAVGPATRDDKQPVDLSNVHVLVVEDSPDNQNLVLRILSKRKAEVTVADNGLEGVNKAINGDFDLILMDVQMPVMDGYTATQTLRAKGFEKPIIALTAHAMNEVQSRCLEVGCTDYLPKPLNSKDLLEKIAKHCLGS